MPSLAEWHQRRSAAANGKRYSDDKPGLRRCSKQGCHACTARGGWWPLAEFPFCSGSNDGLHSHCRACRRELSLRWKRANYGKVLSYAKKWSHENPERKKAKTSEWKKRNVVRNRVHSHNYKHRRKTAKGDLTDAQWQEVLDFYGRKCLLCGSKNPTIDHVLPLLYGGDNTQQNVQPLCCECNSVKGNDCTDFRPDGGAHFGA